MGRRMIMKIRLFTILLMVCTVCCLVFSGCESSAGLPSSNPGKESDEESGGKEGDEEAGIVPVEELDYSSEADLLSFLSGKWDLVDPAAGTVYGELRIHKNGNVTYSHSDPETVDGTITLLSDDSSQMDGLHFYTLELEGLEETFGCAEDSASSSGRFMISQCDGRDYLYLEELGNGTSAIAYDVLISPYNKETYENIMRWVFVRKNKVNVIPDKLADSEFYAMIEENTEDGPVLHYVTPCESEEYDEYTNFNFLAAEFDESADQQSVLYSLAEGADLTGVLDGPLFKSSYPMSVYKFKTDSNGDICFADEVMYKYYGYYDLGDLEQKVETDGLKFTVNGREFDPEFYGIEGNAIMDLEVLDDNLIITSHLNPHMGIYTIFNMRTSWPVKSLYGANFLHGDKVWDSFYSYMDTVYDYEDRVIYQVDGTEICGLSFVENGTKIKIEYWKDDYEKVYEETIERPECLNAPIYAFADFKRNRTPDTWREFLSYAPDDSLFMVMINPPSDEGWDFYQPIVVDEDGLDMMYVVSLEDNVDFKVSGTDVVTLNKAGIQCYNITVPEVSNLRQLVAVGPESVHGWHIEMISGKDDIRYVFN